MPKQNLQIVTFNRGIVDKRILSRVDLDRVNQGAEIQSNYMPSILGSMTFRAGTEYKTSTKDNAKAFNVPFIFSIDDNSVIEFTDGYFRVLTEGVPLSRNTVSTAISNGSFSSNLIGWTLASESGASVTWSSEYSGSALLIGGSNGNRAIMYQELTVTGSNIGVEHGLRFQISRGRACIRIGSSLGASDYFYGNNLNIGYHSIAFIPTGNVFVQIETDKDYDTYIATCFIESGELQIQSPYTLAYLDKIRHAQSGDVIYLACQDFRPRKISRRSTNSWSIEVYQAEDGAFLTRNLTKTTMSVSRLTGNVTITASAPVFESGHVFSLMRIFPSGQNVATTIANDDEYSDYIVVDGVGASRGFTIKITDTWVGTITLQRSFDDGLTWEDVAGKTWTANTSEAYNDALDNTTVSYRLGFKSASHTSGSARARLLYERGGREGIFRIHTFTSATQVSGEVLSPPASINATDDWSFGAWSGVYGYPQSVALHEGRLWFTKGNEYYASVSDAYESFDDSVDGDSKSFVKSIGGNVETAYWLLPTQRLIIGTAGGQRELRSSSLDEPLTATASTSKIIDTNSASSIPAVIVNTNGIYVSGKRLYEIADSANGFGYTSSDLTVLCPDIAGTNFINLAVSRKPETKLHCVRADGKVAILCYDISENLRAWVLWETDGIVENAYVLPNSDTEQDDIYYVINRTINGVTKRYHEKWSMESECIGGVINKNLDSNIYVNNRGSASSVVTGLSHLEGKTVYVWADGLDLGAFTVVSGQINIVNLYNDIVVGLGYTAQYKSTKLAYASGLGTALTQRKIITQIGFNCHNTHIKGFTYGRDFNNLDDLPMSYNYDDLNNNSIVESYDAEMVDFGGTYNTDSRLHIQGIANRPHTISAVILGIQTNDKG